MNAKITITLPINKIHLKVGEILEQVASEFETASIDVTSVSKKVLSETDLLAQLEQIDTLRKKLTLLDANLQDCYSIINGLIIHKTSGKENQNAEQNPE